MIEAAKTWLERMPLAPFLFPLIVVIPFYHTNQLGLPLDDSLPMLLVVLGIAISVFILCRAFIQSWRRAAIFSLIWMAVVTHAPTFADQFSRSGWLHWAVILLVALVAMDLSRRLPVKQEKLAKATLWTNFALIVLAIPSTLIAVYEAIDLELGRPDPHDVFAAFDAQAGQDSPDVWHIVMDRYANREVLLEKYGFDNSAFLNALKQRGFAIEDEAYSNYQITPQSLASTLNADYLDKLIDRQGYEPDRVPLFEAVRKDRASNFFQSQGYEVVFASTWAGITNTHDLADRIVNPRPITEFQRGLLDPTLIARLGGILELPHASERADQCAREPAKFAELREIASEEQRKYVLAHFLVPHPPYLFDREGKCKPVADEISWDRTRNYVEQVEYANAELLKLIDAILAGPRPATILLHGDEGPYPEIYAGDEKYRRTPLAPRKSWANADPELWREKTAILMAVRHANGETQYAPPTPINLYPIVLNRDFNGKLPMRAERNYIFRDVDKIHELTDVTTILRGESAAAE